MKKKILITTVITVMLLSLTGCGALRLVGKLAKGVFGNREEEQVLTPEATPEPETASPTPKPTPTPEPEADPEELEAMKRKENRDLESRFFCGPKRIYLADSYKDVTPDFSPEETIVYTGASEGKLFVLTSRTGIYGRGADNYNLYILTEEGECVNVTPLHLQDEDVSVNSPVAYGGMFYYNYGITDEDGDYHTKVFYYDPEGDAFLEDTDLEELEDMFSLTYEYTSASYKPLIWDLAYTGRIYMTNRDDKTFLVYDREGNELLSSSYANESSYGNFRYYDDKYLLYEEHLYDADSYETIGVRYMIYDMEEALKVGQLQSVNAPVTVTDEQEEVTVIDIRGEDVYYMKKESNPGGYPVKREYYRSTVTGFNPADTSSDQLLCSVDAIPGFSEEFPTFGTEYWGRADAFTVGEDGRCFYLAPNVSARGDDWGNLEWHELTADGTMVKDAVLSGVTERKPEFAFYGEVRAEDEAKYSDTEFLYYTGHYEEFLFRDGVMDDDARKKINDVLSESYKENVDYGKEMAEGARKDYDDMVNDPDYEEGGWLPTYSYDRSFGSLERLAGHYFQLEFDSYEYWGGAHGMPYIHYFMFDADTGEQVKLQDLYPGSEEDFRDLVARLSVEDWKTGGYEKGYYEDYDPDNDNSEEMYDHFRESASFDMLYRFGEEGITVFYMPYDVGPFASGFIGVDIPYSELGFTLK